MLLATAEPAGSANLQGLASLGGATTDSRSDEFTESLQKSAFGLDVPAARIALRAQALLPADLLLSAVIDADSTRSTVLDLQEAWLGWNPVPTSPWRTRAMLGVFFPLASGELAYEQVGWNPDKTISSSAINSWIAQEVRIVGVELKQQWRGALLNVPHTFSMRVALFGGNDPAGTGIAWRGWDVSGRVTGMIQRLRLPDLPVYRPDGAIPAQTRNVHVFRELDHRPGCYGALGYEFQGVLDVEALHYDNRGDPLTVKKGQYSWHTTFNHLGVRLKLPVQLQLDSQAMRGSTLMGPDAVHVRFSSWYLLASRPVAHGQIALRYDWFQTRDRDILPEDPNDESGHAWTLAWSQPLPHSLTLVAEALRVDSRREARAQLGETPRQKENSIALELRWAF